jgi:hypothetical protein
MNDAQCCFNLHVRFKEFFTTSVDRRSKAKTVAKKGEGDRETGAPIEVLNAGHYPTSLSRYSRWRLRTSR